MRQCHRCGAPQRILKDDSGEIYQSYYTKQNKDLRWKGYFQCTNCGGKSWRTVTKEELNSGEL